MFVRPGDFNGDREVGFADFILFVTGFGTREGDPDYRPEFDLDGNGLIVFSDFVRFSFLFGKIYDR